MTKYLQAMGPWTRLFQCKVCIL